jgi:hypothetical protein
MKLEQINEQVMQFWHGGNLDNETSPRSGKWEYGPGLYLTTHYGTAKKYAKGGRKFYKITVEKGNDASDTMLDFEQVQDFVNTYCITSKKKELIAAFTKYVVDGKITADTVLTIIINYNGIKTSNANKLRSFLVNNQVDYWIVNNPFGWGERMMVLFNMKKIIKKEVIKSTDKIETLNLH